MKPLKERWKPLLLKMTIPKALLGKEEERQARYRRLYGEEQWKERAEKDREHLQIGYWSIVMVFFVTLLFCALVSTEKTAVKTLLRPEPGQPDRTEILFLTGEHKGSTVTERLQFTVEPRVRTKAENLELLEQYAGTLEDLILGENASTEAITTDLYFPHSDSSGTISLRWLTDRPDLVAEDGVFYGFRAKGGEVIGITAELSLEEERLVKEFTVTAGMPETEEQKRKALETELRNYWKTWVSGTSSEEELVLLSETPEGIRISWEKRKEPPYSAVLLAFLGSLFLLWKNRYRTADKALQRERQAIHREFPCFLDELLLFLNAGLMVRSALRRMSESYLKRREQGEFSVLQERLYLLQLRSQNSNAALSAELREWALKSGLPELLRFSAVLEDHLQKGTDMAEKLETEADLLRTEEKRQMEERGKKAEVQLAFPMMLLLGGLLLITLAPMLLEF